MACLDIGGHQYVLSPGCLYLIGRKSAGLGNEKQIIGLDCESVDKKHAIVSVVNDAVHVIDLVSSGGSYVDDLRLVLAEQIVKASESVLRFGNMTGKLKLNRTAEKLHDNTSGFNESVKNSSNITSSSGNHSFQVAQAQNQESQSRKSDSFNIPDTQFIPVETNVNTATKNKLLDVDDDVDDDFCIPETQDVLIDTDNTRPSDAVTMLTVQEKQAMKLTSSQASYLGSGTQLRICTQDFNEVENDDSRCSALSDDLLRHSPVVLKGSANERTDDADAELSAINWPTDICKNNSTRMQAGAVLTSEREAAVTPELCDLPKATSKEDRLATCTPDLFDLTELTNKSAATEADQSKVQDENHLNVNSSGPNLFHLQVNGGTNSNVTNVQNTTAASNKSVQNECSKNLQGIENDSTIESDEEDYIATQPFISHQVQNTLKTPAVSSSSTKETHSCRPDSFDFRAPATVPKAADKSKPRLKSAIVYAPPPALQDEDEDDLAPTQVYVPLRKPDNNSTSGKEAHVFSAPQEAAEHIVLSNKENRRANNVVAEQQVATAKPITANNIVQDETQMAGDEDDFIPTQLFIPSRVNRQLNSTLITSDANVLAKNAASFFEAMETTPPDKLMATFKTPDHPVLPIAHSGSSAEPQLVKDLFCTPIIISNNWQQQMNKSKLGHRDESDDETDELGTFDDLVPTSENRKAAACNLVEAQKQRNFKLAFDIKTPPELEQSRADRALKRQIRELCQKTREEPAKKVKHKEKFDAIEKQGESKIDTKAKQQSSAKEKSTIEAKPLTKEKLKSHTSEKEKQSRRSSATREERGKTKPAAKEKGKSGRKADKLQSSPGNTKKRVLRSKLDIVAAPSRGPPAAATNPELNVQTAVETVKQSPEKKTQKIRKPRSKPVGQGREEQLQKEAAAVSEAAAVDPPKKRNTRLTARLVSQIDVDSDKVAQEEQPTKSDGIAAANKFSRPRKKPIASSEELVEENSGTVTSPAPSIFSGSEIYNSQHTDATDNEEQRLPRVKLKRVRKVPEVVVVSDTELEPKQVAERRRTTRQNNKSEAAAIGKSNDQQQLAKNSKKSEILAVETSDKAQVKPLSSNGGTRRTRLRSAEESRAHGQPAATAAAKAKTASSSSSSSRNTAREQHCEPVLAKKPNRLKFATSMVDKERIQSLMPGISPYLMYVNEPTECDVLVMDTPNRTFKFLVAMARGRPILNTKWLEAVSAKQSTRTDGLEHFFPNAEFQKKYCFAFKRSFQLANSKKILADYQFLATPGIQPTPKEFKVIIECAGGTLHAKMPPSKPDQKLYLISNNNDKKYWHKYRRENANLRIVKEEAILLLVMRQSLLPLQEYLLD